MKLLLCLLLPACTATYVKTPQWSVARVSCLSGHDVPTLTISHRGDVAMTGYQGKPSADAIEAVASGIVKGISRP